MRTAAGFGCFLCAAGGILAQQLPLTPPPRILQVYREQVLPGNQADYLRIETEAVATESRLNFHHAYLTLQGVNHPGDVWYVNGYDAYAEIDRIGRDVATNVELTAALERVAADKADLVLDPHTFFARYRQDLSDGHGLSGQHTRYFVVTTVSVRPGHTQDFADFLRLLRGARQQANTGEIDSVYEVESGMPDGTFLRLSPAATLEEAGDSRGLGRRAFETAVDPALRSKLRELSDAAILQSEADILSVSPTISFPAKEWVDAEPEFWNPAAPH